MEASNAVGNPSAPLVFISYSRKDEKWRARLQTFLKPAVDSGLISLWDDRQLETGDKFNEEINRAIDKASVAVLLISAEYLASDWVVKMEAPALLERMEAGGVRIFPILLRSCPWQSVYWLGRLQIFSADKPLAERSRVTQDKLFSEAVKQILDLAQSPNKASGDNRTDEVVQTPRPVPPPVSVRPTPPPVTVRPVPPPVTPAGSGSGSQYAGSGPTPPAPSSRPVPPPKDFTVEGLSSFVLSNEARNILNRARVLAAFGDGARVTTSCLLFSIAEGGRDQTGNFRTPQFLWEQLQNADAEAYAAEFRRLFPHAIYSSSDGTINFDFDHPADLITENVLKIFQRARTISIRTLGAAPARPTKESAKSRRAEEQFAGHVGARHVLGALLILEGTGALSFAAEIVDVRQLRERFLRFIRKELPDDNYEAWKAVLSVFLVEDAELETDTAVANEPETEDGADGAAALSGYSGDFWLGEDLLDITRDVNALACLVAATTVEPPLSIGLFGDWGSGKTHFMKQMKARVDKLALKAKASGKPQNEIGFHKNIVQIEFNAWHYIEGNLWASLVEHIFENLSGPEKQSAETEVQKAVEKARLAVLEQIGLKKELQEQLAERKSELQIKKQEATEKANQAKSDSQETTANLIGLRDELVHSLINELGTNIQFSPDQKDLLKRLGMSENSLRSPARIREQYEAAQSFTNKLAAQWKLFKSDPKVIKKYAVAVLALLIPVVVAWLLKNRLPPIFTGLGSVVTFVLGALVAAKPYWDQFSKGLSALKEKYEQIEHDRQTRITELNNEVAALTKQYKEAEREAETIDKQVAQLESELNTTTARKLLARFIEDRAACSDYRRHLGVLALIRRDFESLSRFLTAAKSDLTESAGSISRIILYIDDLDRCPPERVVQVLQAIHLLLAFPLFVVIVGVDARWVTRSLHESYEWLGVDDDQPEAVKDKRENGEHRAVTPHDYLEKIFQIPFWLKPMADNECKSLLDGLTKDSRIKWDSTQNDNGKEEEAAAPKVELITEITDTVAPAPVVEPASPQESIGSTPAKQTAPPAPSPAVAGADAGVSGEQSDAGNGQPAAQPDTADEHIELMPQHLTLTDNEIEFMKQLSPLIGRSPRAVKRFLNCYRLIKVGLSANQLRTFLQKEGQPGEFTSVMLLLGVITGAPSISLYFIQELEKYTTTIKAINLNTFLNNLDTNPEVGKEQDWPRIKEFLQEQIDAGEGEPTLASLISITPRVSRYSFRVARAGNQSSAGRNKPAKNRLPRSTRSVAGQGGAAGVTT